MTTSGGSDLAHCSPSDYLAPFTLGTWSVYDFLGRRVHGSFQALSLEWLLGARDCPSKQVSGWLVGKGVLMVTGAIPAAFFLTKTEFRTLGLAGYIAQW